MARIAEGSPEADKIDKALADWRQGDVAPDVGFFVHVGDPVAALAEATGALEDEGPQAIESEVAGVAVVTQTCDIVRSCVDRPYVEVAPPLLSDLPTRPAHARSRQCPRWESSQIWRDVEPFVARLGRRPRVFPLVFERHSSCGRSLPRTQPELATSGVSLGDGHDSKIE